MILLMSSSIQVYPMSIYCICCKFSTKIPLLKKRIHSINILVVDRRKTTYVDYILHIASLFYRSYTCSMILKTDSTFNIFPYKLLFTSNSQPIIVDPQYLLSFRSSQLFRRARVRNFQSGQTCTSDATTAAAFQNKRKQCRERRRRRMQFRNFSIKKHLAKVGIRTRGDIAAEHNKLRVLLFRLEREYHWVEYAFDLWMEIEIIFICKLIRVYILGGYLFEL